MVSDPASRSKVALACLFLFCVALFFSAYTARKPEVAKYGHTIVAESLSPLQGLLEGLSAGVGHFWDNYIGLIGLRKDYEALRERFLALEAENSKLLEYAEEIKRLRALLGIAEEQGFKGIAADIISYDPSNWSQVITVSRGSLDGVRRNMPVIQGNAIVGQVVAVAPHVSRILLITDSSSGVDSIIQSNRARGVVEGDGHNLCELRYVAVEEQIAVGERVISSGMDGIFPKGLLVGVVSELSRRGGGLFQAVKVKPAVNFMRLETVLIVTNQKQAGTEATPAPSSKGAR